MSEAVVAQGPTVDRRTYLGGSNIADVCGVGFGSPLSVWAEKRPELLAVPLAPFDSEKADTGNVLERPILEGIYKPRHKVAKLFYPGTLRHPVETWAGASPDAIANDLIDVQVKCVGIQQAWRWGDPDQGADGIPEGVLLQVNWEMWVAGLSVADVVALLGGTDVRVYRVERDEVLIESLVAIGRKFWMDHVVAGAMPEVTEKDGAVIRALFPQNKEAIRDSNPLLERLAHRYDELAEAARCAEAAKKRAGNELCAALGNAAGVQGEWGKATWKMEAGKPAWKAIATELGATTAHVEKHTSEPIRVLRVNLKARKESEAA